MDFAKLSEASLTATAVLPCRILLVDDNAQFLESITHFLEGEPDIEIAGRALSARAALAQVVSLRPDLVLMDMAMRGMSGLEATRRIKEKLDPPRVVIMTLHDDPEYRAAAAEVQADGFVAKAELGTQLLPLIQELFA
jgi:two-component system invasion response regulator UvrY